ncbi:phosphotransferase enzyme family protein [Leptothoe kymatousa]|uniref:Aminoglycoside phosphotransferase family protein n=1 Tax=Leptothoe kymatousa TAU-MAC 1615 TaxID=2364775 RepID=A0ABS5Y1M3_9CYAN|nr:aminoglycoside phosphotransferase family protein [Leptothoe kymatousa]MBT9311717.1 aminoglycoside phosphotransferase family protein [Leptothoe kymatousa TAU-MAC 1615]
MVSESALSPDSPHRLDTLTHIAQTFLGDGAIQDIRPLGDGNINDTYLVKADRLFVLQRINTEVFPQPHLVMDNLCRFVSHVQQKLKNTPLPHRWEVPTVLNTAHSQHHWQDSQGHVWRCLSFVENTTTFNTIQSREHATEVGYGLGCFHSLLSDLSTNGLADTLPEFHITPNYLQGYDRVLAQTDTFSLEEHRCCKLIATHREQLTVLEQAKADGHLPLRSIHGDPKINNILIDTTTDRAVSLIDLDTVKPGLVHYDIGDCLRSSCNPLGEETANWQAVTFDVDLCAAVLQGYLSRASDFLTPVEYDYIYDAIWLIAFELGLRFFSDHLAGDIYFKTQRPQHNLQRALVQFQLAESICQQKQTIQTIISQLKSKYCSEAHRAA